jgi:hypothetical protein
MKRSNAFLMVIGVIPMLVCCAWCLEHERRNKDREASMDASLRLLAKFHIDYVKRSNCASDNYENTLTNYVVAHKDSIDLAKYTAYIKSKK